MASVSIDRDFAISLVDTKLHVLKTELDNIMNRWKYNDVDLFLHDSKHGEIKEAEEDAITVKHLIDQINELYTIKSSWN